MTHSRHARSRTAHRTPRHPPRPPTRVVSTPADLLAVVPTLLGFHPEDSVVLVTVGTARQPFHARADLPQDPAGLDGLTAYLAEVSGRHGLTAVAAVVYSDDAGLAEVLGHRLAVRLEARDVELVVLLRADGERWWALHADRHPDDPPDDPGTPYDVSAHAITTRTVVEGTVVHRSRSELADSLVGSDPDETDRVAVLADELAQDLAAEADTQDGRLDVAPLRARLVEEGRWVQARVARFLGDGRRVDPADVARLATLVSVSAEIQDVVLCGLGRANAGRHVDLWRDVVRRVPADVRAAPAVLLGLSAWVSGAGALAWCAADVAAADDPGVAWGGTLADILSGALPPASWSPPSPAELTLFADGTGKEAVAPLGDRPPGDRLSGERRRP